MVVILSRGRWVNSVDIIDSIQLNICYHDSFIHIAGIESRLQWRHNECDVISNRRHHDGLLNRLFRCRSKKIPKLHVTGLCEGNSLVNALHKGPVMRKMFPFDDVIMKTVNLADFNILNDDTSITYNIFYDKIYHIVMYISVMAAHLDQFSAHSQMHMCEKTKWVLDWEVGIIFDHLDNCLGQTLFSLMHARGQGNIMIIMIKKKFCWWIISVKWSVLQASNLQQMR